MLADEGQEEAPVSTPAAISVPSSAAASKPVAVQPDPAVGYASAVAPTPPVYPAAAPYAPQCAPVSLHPQQRGFLRATGLPFGIFSTSPEGFLGPWRSCL